MIKEYNGKTNTLINIFIILFSAFCTITFTTTLYYEEIYLSLLFTSIFTGLAPAALMSIILASLKRKFLYSTKHNVETENWNNNNKSKLKVVR